MGLHLNFTIDGERQVSAELGISADHLEDFTKPMEKSGDIMLEAVQDNFDQRGARFGGWKPRKYRGDGHPLMEDSGKMRRGFYADHGKDYAYASNDVDYFKYHQSNEPRKVIPRRVMLMIDSQERDDIFKVFQEYVVISLRGKP